MEYIQITMSKLCLKFDALNLISVLNFVFLNHKIQHTKFLGHHTFGIIGHWSSVCAVSLSSDSCVFVELEVYPWGHWYPDHQDGIHQVGNASDIIQSFLQHILNVSLEQLRKQQHCLVLRELYWPSSFFPQNTNWLYPLHIFLISFNKISYQLLIYHKYNMV